MGCGQRHEYTAHLRPEADGTTPLTPDVLEAVPVRDVGLLDAACARPRSTVFGEDAYPDLGRKAAALLHSLVRNHALVDGNKRLGWLATVVFLDLNGRASDLDDDEAFNLAMAVAQEELDIGQIASRLHRP